LFGKLQGTKQEIQDLQEEHSKERQELEQTQEELTRDLKLKYINSMCRKDIIFKRAFS
jgi:kinesin family protein 3/17